MLPKREKSCKLLSCYAQQPGKCGQEGRAAGGGLTRSIRAPGQPRARGLSPPLARLCRPGWGHAPPPHRPYKREEIQPASGKTDYGKTQRSRGFSASANLSRAVSISQNGQCFRGSGRAIELIPGLMVEAQASGAAPTVGIPYGRRWRSVGNYDTHPEGTFCLHLTTRWAESGARPEFVDLLSDCSQILPRHPDSLAPFWKFLQVILIMRTASSFASSRLSFGLLFHSKNVARHGNIALLLTMTRPMICRSAI